MKYLAAYALLVLGGNEHPTADDMTKLFKEVGTSVDKEKLAVMLEKVAGSGKTLPQLIAEGSEKFAAVAPAGGAAAAVADKPAVEDDKAEVKKDEDGDDGLGDGMTGLFDEDEDY